MLETPLRSFQPAQSVQKLDAGFEEQFWLPDRLLRRLDREPDAVNGHTRLVRHFELNR